MLQVSYPDHNLNKFIFTLHFFSFGIAWPFKTLQLSEIIFCLCNKLSFPGLIHINVYEEVCSLMSKSFPTTEWKKGTESPIERTHVIKQWGKWFHYEERQIMFINRSILSYFSLICSLCSCFTLTFIFMSNSVNNYNWLQSYCNFAKEWPY